MCVALAIFSTALSFLRQSVFACLLRRERFFVSAVRYCTLPVPFFFIFRASFSLTTLFSQRILINGREISSFSFSQGKMGIPWRN